MRILARGALLVALVVVVVLFSVLPATSATFATAANLRFVIDNQAIPVLVALAVTVPLICREFDLSVGSVAALTSVVAAAAMTRFGASPFAAVIMALAAGATVGLLNGALVALAGISSIVATLGTASIIAGVLVWYTEGRNVMGVFPEEFSDLGRWPAPLLLIGAISAVLWFVLEQTAFGRRIHAVGSNRRAAHLVGIAAPPRVVVSFVISGLLAGLAGVVSVARNGTANPSIGPAMLLPALAAAFLGATGFRRGFNVWGTVVGVLLVAFTVSGFTLAGIAPWVKDVIDGAMLLVAVAVMGAVSRRAGGERTDSGVLG